MRENFFLISEFPLLRSPLLRGFTVHPTCYYWKLYHLDNQYAPKPSISTHPHKDLYAPFSSLVLISSASIPSISILYIFLFREVSQSDGSKIPYASSPSADDSLDTMVPLCWRDQVHRNEVKVIETWTCPSANERPVKMSELYLNRFCKILVFGVTVFIRLVCLFSEYE